MSFFAAILAALLLLPDIAPVPVSRPDDAAPAAPPGDGCVAKLAALGVTYVRKPALAQTPEGCAIADPVDISAVGATALTPTALLDCPTALAVAEFAGGSLRDIAKRRTGRIVVGLRQDSAFVCRTRNGATRLSEHAYGRALDIGAFIFDDGREIPVTSLPPGGLADAAFLDEVRAAACGPFATVLGPGSDPDHAFHFHFDTAPRRKPFCQ